MITGPRYKIAKRLGATVFEKAQTQKFALSADRSAKNKRRGRGRQSEYGKQMLEKQKGRVTYGLPERQFRNYVNKALAAHAIKPSDRLHELLELRLDNVVWRLGLARTRRGARQMVAHGPILVGGAGRAGQARRLASLRICCQLAIHSRYATARRGTACWLDLRKGSRSTRSRLGSRGTQNRWRARFWSGRRHLPRMSRAISSRYSRSTRDNVIRFPH